MAKEKDKDQLSFGAQTTGNVINRHFEEEMSESYVNYSMSVIIGRAIPEVRDGMKPVQRRILFGMMDLKNWHNAPHKKCARIVGEVIGKYHPHGDVALYEALVRMAQEFNMRYPLVDGQGNFGSIDRDPAAAMRYTEARLAKIAEEMLADIDQDTVDFVPNYDETLQEPVVLPSALPNLLMNGASGIAVGMATNIPPHNLGELVDGLVYLIDSPEATIKDLMQWIKGPDFPTGGKILSGENLQSMYETGQGSIAVEGEYELEEDRIIITEIPYALSKAGLIEQIADYFKRQEKPMIRDIRDESDRRGMRVVIEIARNANPHVALNQILKHSSLRTSFSTKMLVIDRNRKPRVMPLKDLLEAFLEHRYEVVRRRSEYQLSLATKRAHIVEGLMKAARSIDTTVDIIRHSKDTEDAVRNLMETLEVSEEQAKAILDLRLGRLTSMEVDKLLTEMRELNQKIQSLKTLLGDEEQIRADVKRSLIELKEQYANPRRTRIETQGITDMEAEDLIEDQEVIITVTRRGYILQTELADYRRQYRGGRGAKGIKTREEDWVRHIMSTSKLDHTMFISSKGKAYTLRNYEIESTSKGSKGKHLMSYLKLDEGEVIRTVLEVGKDFHNGQDIIIVTEKGKVKRSSLKDFGRAGTNGVIAIRLEEGDQVVDAILIPAADETSRLFIATKNGMSIQFPTSDTRRLGRNTIGVKAIDLKKEDRIVSLTHFTPHPSGQMTLSPGKTVATVLTVTEKGFGKRTPIEEYRLQSRGGKGIKNLALTPSAGKVVSVHLVDNHDEILVVTKSGFTIRFRSSDIRSMGRVTRGVRAIDLSEEDEVASVELVTGETNDPTQSITSMMDPDGPS